VSDRDVAVLLRAVNVAGHRLPMADFKAVLAAAGFADARTLGATGNAVIRAEVADAPLEARIEAAMATRFGATPDVLVRDGAALAAVLAANPYPKMAEEDPSHLLVMFLRGEPPPAGVEALRAKISGPEEIAAGPQCLYVRYPDDIGHSKLTSSTIERAFKLRGTGRNWNTVRKLAAMVRPA